MALKRGAFIEHLVEEHRMIRSLLVALNKRPPEDLSQLKPLLQSLKFLVEDVHHKKEEELLFPALLRLAPLKEGGPRCTLFFGMRLENNIAEKLTQEGRLRGLAPPNLRAVVRNIFETNNPLSIPAEEHVAGHLALELLGLAQNEKSFKDLASRYVELMDLHIRKEDECLFVATDIYLPATLQEELLEKALEINRSENVRDRLASVLGPH